MIYALDIDRAWPGVVREIQAIADEYDGGFGVEETYRALKEQRSFLYFHTSGNGFIIVTPEVCKWTKKVSMLVTHGFNNDFPAGQDEYLADLNELAAGMGAKEIVINSNRRGFERCGWDVQVIRYSRKVVTHEQE